MIIATAGLVLALTLSADWAHADPSCGDADASQTIRATDALVVLKSAVGKPIECPLCACDVNGDGGKTTTDALLVLKRSVGAVEFLTCFAGQECETPEILLDDFQPVAASPCELVTANVNGLDAAADHFIRFFNDQGLSLVVPAVGATANTVTAATPPIQDGGGGAAVAGTVNLHVLEEGDSGTGASNALAGLDIEALPDGVNPAGTVTLDFLEGAIELCLELQQTVVGSAMDSEGMRQAIADTLAVLEGLQYETNEVVNDSQYTFPLGSIGDEEIVVGAGDLAQVDRVILAMLLAQANQPDPGGGSAGGGMHAGGAREAGACARADANDYFDDLKNGRPTDSSRTSYFGAGAGCAADAFNTAYAIVGGAAALGIGVLALGGAPVIALALPAAAVLYVNIAGAGGLIGLGGALGQTTEEARDLVEAGVNQVESTLRSMVAGKVLPKTVGTLHSMIQGAEKIHDEFAEGEPPTTVTTTTTLVTTTTTHPTTTIAPVTTTIVTTTTLQQEDCWCCCAWWDGCCTEFTCREFATDQSGAIGDLGNCFYYAPWSNVCGTGWCESG